MARTPGERNPAGARRVYYASWWLFLTALYGVPVAFAANLVLRENASVRLVAVLVTWAVFGAIVARLMRHAYARGAAPRAGGGSGVDLLAYTAIASSLLFAVAGGPALLLPEGAWFLLVPPGIGFFSCAILLAVAALYSLLGLAKGVRERFYPEYPALTAALLFALGAVAFVAYYAFGL